MKAKLTAIRSIQFAVILSLAACSTVAAVESGNGRPATAEVVTTNWVERALTNVIEIQIPKLVIVEEFRTNTTSSFATNLIEVQRKLWVDKYKTNVTYALYTNWVTMTETNIVALDQYRTNVIDVLTTNFFTAYTTNLLTRTLTNTLVVDQVQTNFFYAFQTNHTTMSITNWDTVLVMKTNWITRPVTNVVEIDLPAPRSTSTASPPTTPAVPEAKGASIESLPISPAEDMKNLVLEWTRESKKPTEIVLTLKSENEAETTVQVQEWRVERSDATMLLMGRGPEFRAELPAGTYNVTVKARRSENGPALSLHGSIKVTPDADTHQVLVAAAN